MKLNEQQINSITFGAIEIYRDEDGIYRFKRMTDRQAEEFARENESFAVKTTATSGVRFDFYTDADFVAFRFDKVKIGSSRNWYSYDLYVNGKLAQTLQKDIADTEGEIYQKLDGKNNRIQLFLPCIATGGITYIELSDGATVTPAVPSLKMLVLGDSITQGYDAHLTSCCYANLMARELDAEIVNQAIGGAKFYKEQLEYTGEYDVVTVAYGTNDWSTRHSFESFCSHCEEYFKTLSEMYPNAKKFAILPIWRKHWYTEKPTGNFFTCRKFISDTAEKYGVIPLDSIDYVPHDSIFFEDKTLHPNDIGFVAYAKKLVADLRKYL